MKDFKTYGLLFLVVGLAVCAAILAATKMQDEMDAKKAA